MWINENCFLLKWENVLNKIPALLIGKHTASGARELLKQHNSYARLKPRITDVLRGFSLEDLLYPAAMRGFQPRMPMLSLSAIKTL
jgi:hypothetical protein